MLMNNYVLLTDSASDLPLEIAKNLNIEVLPMQYTLNGETFTNENFDVKSFYGLLRKDVSSFTTQINIETFSRYFEDYLKDGNDIIYVGIPLCLSGMNSSAKFAAKELLEKYPDRKIIIVDSMCASIGQGLLVYYAALKKINGSSICELERWINENKLKFCHWFTVDDLNFLKKGGRISKTVAVVGSILNVKPLMSVKDEGQLYVFTKIRGRKKVLDFMSTKIVDLNPEYSKVFVGHGDSADDANYLAERLKNIVPNVDVTVVPMGPIIGTHTGPGTVSLAFFGSSR